jgi:hypothetical protein
MSRWTKGAAALATAALAAAVFSASPASSAEEAPAAYTVVLGDSGCELAMVDLTTGALSDLPAGASPLACATDLAVSTDGTVYGLLPGPGSEVDAGPLAVDAARLVTFAADGTPSATPIEVADGTEAFLALGGLAITSGGTVYAQMVTDSPGCDAEAVSPPSTGLAPTYAGDSVCLFTVDPAAGTATLVGTTGLFETVFAGLTSCSSGLRSVADTSENGTLVSESATTGLVTPLAPLDTTVSGYDCQSTGDTLYAVVSQGGFGVIGPAAVEASVGTLDQGTGAYTAVAPLSDQGAQLVSLAVVPASAPTPTTEPPAVEPDDTGRGDQVVPSFTG